MSLGAVLDLQQMCRWMVCVKRHPHECFDPRRRSILFISAVSGFHFVYIKCRQQMVQPFGPDVGLV